jgi:hypothetical protein
MFTETSESSTKISFNVARTFAISQPLHCFDIAIFRGAKPYDNGICHRVDVVHHLDFRVPLGQVGLIDAQSIDP